MLTALTRFRLDRRYQAGAKLVAVSLGVLLHGSLFAQSALPQRDLLVELRQVDAARLQTGNLNLRSGDAAAWREHPVQQVRVHNGSSATVQLSTVRPVQYWHVVPDGHGATAVPSTQWLEAGRSLTIRPRWPGGRQSVVIEVKSDTSRFDASVAPGSAELPARSNSQLRTTVSVPLGQWVTLASSTGGGYPYAGTLNHGARYGTQYAGSQRSLLQVRVELVE